ncbi:MAG: hypothetical protein Q9165_002286 [Trypethelium subeluteriae]
MAPKKKKTKPAANPARGFATTSMPSKPKPDDSNEASKPASEVPSKGSDVTKTEPTVEGKDKRKEGKDAPADLHQLSPEDLELQLENSELQLLVDRHSSKVRQHSSRTASKLLTDKRVLRGQAVYLSARDWLPDDLINDAMDIIREEERSAHDLSSRQAKGPGIAEEDLVVKLWSLRETLLQAGFDLPEVGSALKSLVNNPAAVDADGTLWGLAEALDYFAIHSDVASLPSYSQELNRSSNVSLAPSRSDTPDLPIETQRAFFEPSEEASSMSSPITGGLPSHQSPHAETDDLLSPVGSDVDSDFEPDRLQSTYIETKSRLFQRKPDLAINQTSNKKAKAAKPSSGGVVAGLTPDIKKLQQRLQRIESDPLFDRQQAEDMWRSKHIILVREDAERRRLELGKTSAAETVLRPQSPDDSVALSEITQNDVGEDKSTSASGIMDEAEMLGDLFATMPEDTEASLVTKVQDEHAKVNILIRNFGTYSGMSPKRVLEETCRARDSSVKLSFKHISPTTYASRHALSIAWSRDREIPDASMIPSIHCSASPRRLILTMTSVATPELVQSESYIATAALFILFSGSPKEEKAHLRLPPVWRDLWAEFATAKQELFDAAEREVLRSLRDMVRLQPERVEDEDEDVILTNGFRRRAQNMESGTSSPAPEQDTTTLPVDLQEVWKRKTSTSMFQRMLPSRLALPIARFRDDALATIERSQVTIICGETGCGKSTQLPAYLLENQLSQGKDCKIYCTQPRRISAISLAQRVSEELGEHKKDCGTSKSLVGYAIRLESQITPQTRLVYATVGIVLRMFESVRGLEGITHLIIDEVHERSIDTDFLLILLRPLMIKRPDLKVILMSATVDADRFSKYLDNAPILTVPGRTFPVHTKFLEDAIEVTGYRPNDAAETASEELSEDNDEGPAETNQNNDLQNLQGYSKNTANVLRNFDEYRVDYGLILALLEKVAYDPAYTKYSKAILVFLPGINEIRKLNDMLMGHPRFMHGWLIHSLHSTISSEDQQQAFLIPPQGMRKIVLSTNIAETSVTIPDIVCVIDTAKHKEMRYDERRQLSRLIQAFVSRANAKQRRGRAGRVQEGICFHLITKHRHDNIIASQQTPEILRLSLQELCMRVKICKLGDIADALSQALDPPSAKNIQRAIDALVEVNALTAAQELTDLGKQLAKLPLDAHLGKLLLMSSIFGCIDFALTIAATLSSKSPFVTPIGQKQRADSVRLGFKKGDSDLLTAYNAYCAWRRVCQSGTSDWQFCKKNFLSPQNLNSIEDLKAQLLGSLVDANFVTLGPNERAAFNHGRSTSRYRNFVPEITKYNANNDSELILNSVVAWSFYPKLLIRDGKGWRNIANNQSVSLHPTSVNKTSNFDIKYLSFYHIMQSSTRFTNAHETSPCPDISLALLAGDADFRLYTGVIVIDGNRLRFMVDSWKVILVLKILRQRMEEAVERTMKKPGVALPHRLERWMGIWRRVMSAEGKRTS